PILPCNAPATSYAYTLSLHDALPICRLHEQRIARQVGRRRRIEGCDRTVALSRPAVAELAVLLVKQFRANGIGRYWIDNILERRDRKSTRLNSSHQIISYAVFCLKKK